ncbi:MAG: hypothetical protein KGI70_02725 [Patescibacteria group bacterium]|nr:hypothetical protein [Patescibacteria group bacterium]
MLESTTAEIEGGFSWANRGLTAKRRPARDELAGVTSKLVTPPLRITPVQTGPVDPGRRYVGIVFRFKAGKYAMIRARAGEAIYIDGQLLTLGKWWPTIYLQSTIECTARPQPERSEESSFLAMEVFSVRPPSNEPFAGTIVEIDVGGERFKIKSLEGDTIKVQNRMVPEIYHKDIKMGSIVHCVVPLGRRSLVALRVLYIQYRKPNASPVADTPAEVQPQA